jgi:hypothetical protein
VGGRRRRELAWTVEDMMIPQRFVCFKMIHW